MYSKCNLQALVYDILPSTTAITATGFGKLSTNGQFFFDAQVAVSL